MIAFNLLIFTITLVLVIWILQDPENNTKMFLNIPSIAVLLYSLVVLGTDWSMFGDEFEAMRMFLAGIVAIPYVTAAGFAFFIRVYTYMWKMSRTSTKRHRKISIEDLLRSR